MRPRDRRDSPIPPIREAVLVEMGGPSGDLRGPGPGWVEVGGEHPRDPRTVCVTAGREAAGFGELGATGVEAILLVEQKLLLGPRSKKIPHCSP
jgi:hypothetical protein